MGEPLGLSQSNIRDLESGKVKFSTLHALAIENIYKISSKWLLTGEGSHYIKGEEEKKSDNDSNLTRLVVEHQDTIKKFKDPEKAKEFNEFLVDIEAEDPEGYDELYKEAKLISKTINRLKKTKENKGSSIKKRVNGK